MREVSIQIQFITKMEPWREDNVQSESNLTS